MSLIDQHSHFPVKRRELGWAIGRGAQWGIVAGLVFAVYEMFMSAALEGASATFMPLRMIGAILLGEQALDPGYSLLVAASAGVFVHLALSAIYGIVFMVIAGGLIAAATDLVLGTIFGLVLWGINFYWIAPRAFPWFLDADPLVQAIGHGIFFGTALGWFVWRAHRATRQISWTHVE